MNKKSFAAGLLVGVVAATTVTATAANMKVEAWLADSMILNIDGSDVTLPEGYHILNYQDRIYVPYRFAAETLGATVKYDADAARVSIVPPPPVVERVEVEVPVPASDDEKKDSNRYDRLPVRLKQSDIIINVIGTDNGIDTTYMYFDFENDTDFSVRLDYEEAYMEVDGIKFETDYSSRHQWTNSIAERSIIEDAQLVFEEIPSSRYHVKLVIPVILEQYPTNKGYSEVVKEFVFYLDIENPDLEETR